MAFGLIASAIRHVGAAPGSREDTELTTAQLFALLWSALADTLGTAATAVLVRCSARGAALEQVAVRQERLEYTYTLPPSWSDPAPAGLEDLRELCRGLRPLLVELTGTVVLRHLESVAPLRASGLSRPSRMRRRGAPGPASLSRSSAWIESSASCSSSGLPRTTSST